MVKVNLYGDDDFLIGLVLCLVHRLSSTLIPALYVFCIFVTITTDRVIEKRHAKGEKEAPRPLKKGCCRTRRW